MLEATKLTKYFNKVTAEELPQIKEGGEEGKPFLVLMEKNFRPDYCI